MEKDTSRCIFRVILYKNLKACFLSEIVVFIFRCISSRVLGFCSPCDVIALVRPYPYLLYCIEVSWCLLSFTWQIFSAFRSLSILFIVGTRFLLEHDWHFSFLLSVDSKEQHFRCRSSTGRVMTEFDTSCFVIDLSRYILLSYAFVLWSSNSGLWSWSCTLSTLQ